MRNPITCLCDYYSSKTVDRYEDSEDWRPFAILKGVVMMFWALIILTSLLFEVMLWSMLVAVILYLTHGVLGVAAGCSKNGRLISCNFFGFLVSLFVIVLCILINITTFEDEITLKCSSRGLSLEKCDEMRLFALVIMSIGLGINILVCGIFACFNGFYWYTAKMDQKYNRL